MAKSKRMLFTFDPRSCENLKQLTDEGPYSSMADAVREAVQVSEVLHRQARQGFTEVVVRNPETSQERVVIVPTLDAQARRLIRRPKPE